MRNVITERRIIRYSVAQGFAEDRDLIVAEQPLTVHYNEVELVTLLCTPEYMEDLAIGYLAGEGLLKDPAEVEEIRLDKESGQVFVYSKLELPEPGVNLGQRYLASSSGKGLNHYRVFNTAEYSPLPADTRFFARSILKMMQQLLDESEIHQKTGGVHSAALGEGDRLYLRRDDIGRHNAVDKIYGHCFTSRVNVHDKILLVSGRVSSEIVSRAAKMGVSCLASRSAPTDSAVTLAGNLGLTLIGFTRGDRFNIYAHPYRIIDQE